jgi:hypothetical protein
LRFIGHTLLETHTHTHHKSPLNERSACRRDRYKNTPLAGIEPEIPAIERLQNYPLNRTAKGMGSAQVDVYEHILLSNPVNELWLRYKDRPDSAVKELSRSLEEQYATQSTKHSLPRYRVLNLNPLTPNDIYIYICVYIYIYIYIYIVPHR